MSADDIRLAVDFWDHPKTQKLERRLGLVAVKALIKLWMWAAKNRPSGDLGGLDDEDLVIAAGWPGEGDLVAELAELKWLDGEPLNYSLHDWQVHNPWASSAEERSGVGRLSKLAQINKPAYDKLKKKGVERLTKEQFAELAYPKATPKATPRGTLGEPSAPSSKFLVPSSKLQVPSSKIQVPIPMGEKTPAPATAPPPKQKFGENEFVRLTPEEHAKLCERFGAEQTGKAIAFLDLHIGAKGRDDYKSHNLALQKWVFDAVRERERKQAGPSPRGQPLTIAERKQTNTINAINNLLGELDDGG